jgi:hypothetical protein
MSKLSVIKDTAEKAFEAEYNRTEYQITKAEKFIAGITAVMGFQIFEAKDLLKDHCYFKIMVGASLILLTLALIFTLLALRVRDYLSYSRGTELKDLLNDPEADEEKASREIADMLLGVREHNARLNDKNADMLRISGWLLLLGFLVVIATQILKGIL